MQAILVLILTFLSVISCSPVTSFLLENDHRKTHLRRNDPTLPERAVFVQFTTKWYRKDNAGDLRALADLDAQDMRSSIYHTSIEIQGDGVTNGNIRIEVDINPDSALSTFDLEHVVHVRDYGTGSSQAAPVTRFAPNDRFIKVYPVGTVQINNADLLDTTGKGIVTDVWSPNRVYSTVNNNCIMLVGNLLGKLGIQPPAAIAGVFAETEDYALMYMRHGRVIANNVPVRLDQYPASGDASGKETWVFDVEDAQNPQLLKNSKAGTAIGELKPSTEILTGTTFDGSIEITMHTFPDMWSPFDGNPPLENYPDPADKELSAEGGSGPPPPDSPWAFEGDTTPAGESPSFSVEGTAEVAIVRSGGVVSVITSFAEKSLAVLGVAGIAVAAVFIILDIIDGEFKAAAFGAAGVAAGVAGIAADLLAAGPVATLIGLAVGVLFTILPGLIDSFKDSPPTNNPAQIIQFAFFGDKDHTGNEECNKQRAEQNLSQNCTAVYGAGVVSKIFNWDIFDSIVFLIEYNDGHPMSIIEIAAAFQVKDYTVNGWGSNVTAVIDCGKRFIPPPGPNEYDTSAYDARFNQSPSAGYDCGKPSFSLKRPLINIPTLNASADTIYSRIIPASGGDCKLLSDPAEGINLPVFDITITGRPVAIACNLTAGSTLGIDSTTNYTSLALSNGTNSTSYSTGSVLVYNAATNTTTNTTLNLFAGNQSISSNGSSVLSPNITTSINGSSILYPNNTISTDGSTSRAYVAPPPPVSFAPYNASNSVCILSPTASLCLPNGTYGTSNGTLGFNTKGSSGLSLPQVGSLSFSLLATEVDPPTILNSGSQGDNLENATVNFVQNITAGSSTDFSNKMNLLAPSGRTFDIFAPQSPPGVCLHVLKNYMGDVQCFGLGGTNLTGPIVNQASSLSIWGNATVWIYGASYGDLGGELLSTNSADLSELPYGSDGSFNKQIKAMWISMPD